LAEEIEKGLNVKQNQTGEDTSNSTDIDAGSLLNESELQQQLDKEEMLAESEATDTTVTQSLPSK